MGGAREVVENAMSWQKIDPIMLGITIFPYKSKSCGLIFKKLMFLKNRVKNTANKKDNPHPIKGAARGGGRRGQKWKNPSFYELNS